MATAKASAPSPDVTSTKLAVQKFLLIGTMVAANSPASTRMAPANARRRMCLGAPAQRASAMPKKPLAIEGRSEEHTSELQSLMRISYAVFCLQKKIYTETQN